MPSPRMLRIGGLALVAAAIIQLPSTMFDPDLMTDPRAIQNPAWVPTHLGFLVTYSLMLPGLVALYLRQAERLGWLGELGVVAAMIGSVLTASVSTLVGVALPLLAPRFPDLPRSLAYFEPGRPLHSVQSLVAFTALTYFPGFIVTGLVTMRAGVMPRWTGLFMTMGALGTLGALAGPGSIGRTIVIAGSVLLALAFARIGVALIARS